MPIRVLRDIFAKHAREPEASMQVFRGEPSPNGDYQYFEASFYSTNDFYIGFERQGQEFLIMTEISGRVEPVEEKVSLEEGFSRIGQLIAQHRSLRHLSLEDDEYGVVRDYSNGEFHLGPHDLYHNAHIVRTETNRLVKHERNQLPVTLEMRMNMLEHIGLLTEDELNKINEIQKLSDNSAFKEQAAHICMALMCGFGNQLNASDLGPRVTIQDCLEKDPQTGRNWFEELAEKFECNTEAAYDFVDDLAEEYAKNEPKRIIAIDPAP